MSTFSPRTGVLYILGGWSGSAALADFWAYDTARRRWTQLSADVSADGGGPSARNCGAALLHDEGEEGWMYVLGRYVPKMTEAEKRRLLLATQNVGSASTTGEVTSAVEENANRENTDLPTPNATAAAAATNDTSNDPLTMEFGLPSRGMRPIPRHRMDASGAAALREGAQYFPGCVGLFSSSFSPPLVS